MDDFDNETTYSFIRQGTFGIFQTAWSFPLEFFQISFTPEELSHLSLAKDLKPSKRLDFDMLLQRDIDEQRVTEQMQPYLTGVQKKFASPAEGAVFFPPLLAAIVPVQENEIIDFYNHEKSIAEGNLLKREWHGHFRVTHRLTESIDAITIESYNLNGTSSNYSVKRNPAELAVRLVTGDNGRGAKLVVIDGQHRLVTLKNLQRDNPEILNGMAFPVCIVYAPQCTSFVHEKKEKDNSNPIPRVPDVFRKLFVDVNSTMERVSGHFEFLLNDIAIETLAARQFCKHVLREYGKPGLACVEWNEKNYKNSKDINRPYSVTSVGVIAPAIQNNLEKHYPYLLNYDGIQSDLFREGEEPKLSPQRLTLFQKPAIQRQVADNLVPLLVKIFFDTEEYNRIFQAFKEELAILHKEAEETGRTATIAQDIIDHLLDYVPLRQGNDAESKTIASRLRAFTDGITTRLLTASREEPIVNRVLFQKAMFETLDIVIKEVKKWNPEVSALSSAFNGLLDSALSDKGRKFSPENVFFQYSVFNQKKIQINADSRKAMSKLLLAHLATPGIASAFVDKLDIDTADHERATSRLIDLGKKQAVEVLKIFNKRRLDAFIKSYSTDLSIPLSEREELQSLEELKQRDYERAQRGEIDQSEISNSFDIAVESKILEDILEARKQLQSVLNLDFEIVTDRADGNLPDTDE
ncbi:hypothetical protein [Burkholderia anthina]|uniref:hypothetical protein n=1 Tax=Burkholderia anthina TaxID=179879 RepID=UPI00158D030A|nr:hypothetical protein [Burkholderia anthina]